MIFFRRLALHRFVSKHSPARQVTPASGELLAAYDGILPASLLELWRKKGLGFYGKLQLALIDPAVWQPVLDSWIISPPSSVQRIPLALTPFGTLLYYRKLSETDEDVAYIDPVSKETDDLSWSLDEFFNDTLCRKDQLDAIISPALLRAARQECGPLAPGEVYEIDQTLLSMQMLRIAKVDALDLHRRLRDALQPPEPKAAKPETVVDALPQAHRSNFANIPAGQGLAGLYLSSYIDWHRLLALKPDGQYRLLFWRIHHQTFERTEIRVYEGAYKVSRNAAGDEVIALDIVLRANSLGSDANDEQLIAMHSGETVFLLRSDELDSMATAIGGRDVMGRSDAYFRRVALEDAFPKEPGDGCAAPPFAALPKALQALIHVEPLSVTITHVAEPDPDEEYEGEGTVMCTLDLGEEDGLRHNMPLYSPQDTGRRLIGWVWDMSPHACKAGIKYRRAEDGTIAHGPVAGDILTTRQSAGPVPKD